MDALDANAKLTEAFVANLDAQVKLIEALREVRDRQTSGADDWELSLLSTFVMYLEAIGVDRELRLPVFKMCAIKREEIVNARRRQEGKSGTPKPADKTLTMALAAAAVTVLKQQGEGKIGDLLTSVARAAGIDRKELESFRDNITGVLSPQIRVLPISAM